MVDFTGIASVADRTLFTNKGPIVKRPLPLLTGSDLRVVSYTEVEIASGSFTDSDVGKVLSVSGSPDGRNDGDFRVDSVVSSKRLRLAGASFSILDEAATVASCVALVNDLAAQYSLHRYRKVSLSGVLVGVHGTDDAVNLITAGTAVGFASAVTLANDILAKFDAHAVLVSGTPKVHVEADDENVVALDPASSLPDLVALLNELRRRYEMHRQSQFVHQHVDLVDRVSAPPVRPTVDVYPGPFTGPFIWTLMDPRYGKPADSPYDVDVTVNGLPASVDAVFGLIGAVVLSSKPSWSDSVSIDYDYIDNPPSRFMRLNSPEFTLNQYGNTALAGFPKHRYRSSSHLLTDVEGPGLQAPYQPLRRGWKYKAIERAYSAVLNDPTSLLLNVPTNKLAYPVLFEKVSEVTVRYDPLTLPQDASDPWRFIGQGTLSLAPGGSALTVADLSTQTGTDSKPPFFTHPINLDAASVVSCAFRVRMSADPAVFLPDGVFSGVSFGLSDGRKTAIVGLLLTEATNLSSAIVMANDVRAQINGHVVNVGSHFPDDVSDSIEYVDSFDLASLLALVNRMKESYNDHVAKGSGVGLVHLSADAVNVVMSPDAETVEEAVVLVNELRSMLNAHGTQAGVHFTSDSSHQVSLVRQAGLLTNRGFPELASSWNAFASDWTGYRTFLLKREPDGSASVFVSGSITASAEAALLELPAASDVDAEVDLLQQAFFGSISKDAKSSSQWQFVRVNVYPVDANLIEDNKQVDYGALYVPELDPDAPWVTYGQSGSERVLSPSVLLLDSSASAAPLDIPGLGLVSGAYRGYLRSEPVLSTDNALVFEFKMGADYWTQSVNDRAFGVFMSDGSFSVQLAFLQASPTSAVTVGTVSDPFVLASGDTLIVQIGSAPPVTVSFPIPPVANTAASVAARINSVLGFPFASAQSGRVRLSSQEVGSSASFSVLSGSSLAKLGFSPGTYFGSDSTPEPKMSWFGANLPELDDPSWVRSGGQSASLYNRVLRVTDVSILDYLAWTLEDPLVTNQVLNPSTDWKLDARLAVLSFVPGPTVPASSPYLSLDFAGALVSVDEGPSGKNVELHLSVDTSGSQFLNLLSYDASVGSLDVVAQYAFAWNDGLPHTLNVYTSKGSNTLMVLADGVPLAQLSGPAPTYSGLHSGVSGPSLSFGSGGEPVSGSDIRVCRSVVDWYSVSAFGDSKISDSYAPSRRYVGVYRGGAPDVLSSYYLHQVDWAPQHTYRIMRDPSAGLQVYLDGAATPSISVPYDVLTLPPASSSFLYEATRGRPFVAFGAFSPSEFSRTRWDFVRYSIGKVTLTDLLVPPHQLLNQANVVASPDHLRTQVPHKHQGFTVYSGGTPIDEFMSDEDVAAFTVLGEGTPPVPATQNLETRHGMVKVGTPLDTVPALDAVSFPGFTTDLVDDTFNEAEDDVISTSVSLALLIGYVNGLRAAYESHRVYPGVHAVNDTADVVTSAPASTLSTAITLVNNIKAKFNLHLVRPGVHVPDDTTDEVDLPDATDLPTASDLAIALVAAYVAHAGTGAYHLVPDTLDVVVAPDASDLASSALLADTLADSFAAHSLSTVFHEAEDVTSGKFAPPVLPGVGKAGVTGLSVLATSDSLPVGRLVKFLDGPNAGQARVVVAKLSSAQYQVAPGFVFNDLGQSRYVRLGSSSVTTAIATSGPGYSVVDVVGPAVSPSVGDQVMFLSGPNYGEIRTVSVVLSAAQFRISPVLPVSDPGVRSMTFVVSPSVVSMNPAYVVSLANSLKSRLASHRTAADVHRTDDIADVVTVRDAAVLADTYPLLNALKAAFNVHLSGSRYHLLEDTFNVVTADPAVDPLEAAIESLNSARSAYLAHLVQPRVHLQDDDLNVLLPPDADDLESAVDLANSLKDRLDRHLSAVVHEVVGPLVQKVHSEDDVVNVVTAPDAVDLDSLCVLSAAVLEAFNSHRVQPGVHGSTLLVRLDPPARVIYEGMRFWTSDTGDALAKVAPFSDDILLQFTGPITYTDSVSYSFRSDILPQQAGWDLVASDPNSVSVSLISIPENAARIVTAGSTAVLRRASSLPDMYNIGFVFEARLRINSFAYSPNVETGIYAGFLGNGDDGYSAAIGFDALNNIPYVKIQDVKAGMAMLRVPFNWGDGAFHTYRVTRDPKTDALLLQIMDP